jgi:hypothetical protein
MGLTANVVANTPILSTWGNELRDRSVQVFATVAERSAQWPTPPNGAVSWITATLTLHVFNGAVWVQVTPAAAANNAGDTHGAGAYGDGAGGAGPAVTVLTGTKALVSLTAHLDNAGGASAVFMGYAISGATTLAPTDDEALGVVGPVGFAFSTSYESYVTGLTPGANTFTAKYRAASGTVSFALRKIRVQAIP